MTLSFPRRRLLAMAVQGLAGGWSIAAAALAGLYLATPLRRRRSKKQILIGDLSIYGAEFRAIPIRVPVEDGWRRRVERRMAYIRAGSDGLPEVILAKCTHLGCGVAWHAEHNEFRCPCHGGRFAPDGTVIAGPPPAPLEHLASEIRGGDVYVEVDV